MLDSFWGDRKVQLAAVNICSLTPFSFPPHKLLFRNVGVKGHDVINWSSQLPAVSKQILFLSANELEFGVGSTAFFQTELYDMTAGLCYCVTLFSFEDKKETKGEVGKPSLGGLILHNWSTAD